MAFFVLTLWVNPLPTRCRYLYVWKKIEYLNNNFVVFCIVGWMVALCLVGRHWYVECEQIISQEYPARLPSMRQRFRTWSTWSRKGHHHKSGPSMISERTPQVLDKLMQSKSWRRKLQNVHNFSKWIFRKISMILVYFEWYSH